MQQILVTKRQFLPRDAMHARLQVGVLRSKQNHTIAQGLQFSDAKDLREIRPVAILKTVKSPCTKSYARFKQLDR